MRPDLDVVLAPLLDDDAGFSQRVEDLAVEEFVAHAGIEAFDIAIFPWRARFDVGRFRTNSPNPVSDFLSNELRTVVGTNVLRRTAQNEQIRQDINDIRRVEFAGNADHQWLLCKLINDVEDAVGAPVMRPVLHEVIGPDVIGPLRSETDAGSVVQPEPPALFLLRWDFQPFTLPDPFNALVVDVPAGVLQQTGDDPVSVVTILAGKDDDVLGQLLLIGPPAWNLALRGSVLTKYETGPTF